MCNNGECEDELHFVMTCAKYTLLRKDLFNFIGTIYLYFKNLNDNVKFNMLMSQADKVVLEHFTAYIYACFQARSIGNNPNPTTCPD